MRRLLVYGLVALFTLLPAGAILAQEGTPEPEEVPPTVFVREDPVLGRYLSDPAGMTLYLFTQDTVPNESTCYDDCATAWPPFSAAEPLALPQSVEGELTLFERTDGTTQVAYNGMPLYYWQNDLAPGDVTGQGVGDVWWVVAPGAQMGVVATPVAPTATDMGTPVAAGEITVSEGEFFIQSSAATFSVGQEYTFNVTNIGEFTHEFVVEPAGSMEEAALGEIEEIEPGQSASLAVTFTDPGNYQLACHLFSHYQNGMALNVKVLG